MLWVNSGLVHLLDCSYALVMIPLVEQVVSGLHVEGSVSLFSLTARSFPPRV